MRRARQNNNNLWHDLMRLAHETNEHGFISGLCLFLPWFYSNISNGQALKLHVRAFSSRIRFMAFNIYIVGYICLQLSRMSFLFFKGFNYDLPSSEMVIYSSLFLFSW